jgi:hypothetical protein
MFETEKRRLEPTAITIHTRNILTKCKIITKELINLKNNNKNEKIKNMQHPQRCPQKFLLNSTKLL